jgi:hypothetical protein
MPINSTAVMGYPNMGTPIFYRILLRPFIGCLPPGKFSNIVEVIRGAEREDL